jgi:hypothetical protein
MWYEEELFKLPTWEGRGVGFMIGSMVLRHDDMKAKPYDS